MPDTKELILQAALTLFAQNGYEAVSVRDIAAQLSITKGALYKHYENKRDIFNSILRRMEESDAQHAKAYSLPEGAYEQMAEAYGSAALKAVKEYSVAQYRCWTEEAFSAAFRRLLTLEQYKSPEMAALYQQYLAGGPLRYLTDLFRELLPQSMRSDAEAKRLALAFYAPIYLGYSLYDGTTNKEEITAQVAAHIQGFALPA
ncbi:MAG: helix-turn-helix domain containing protein [Eubacteriales bacterium]|nr:helix-turn-helix domain containing protein [Eubacteriales bacterium]